VFSLIHSFGLQASADDRMELNHAATVLNVSKNKIEDVSSILEGVGYVEKISTDIVKLTNTALTQRQQTAEQQKLSTRLEQVVKEEATLNNWISHLQVLGSDQKSHEKDDIKQSPTRTVSPRTAYYFGDSSPFKKAYTPSDRLVQVSSEDTEESTPSTRSDSSSSYTHEPFHHPLSDSVTINNARKRVLLLSNSTASESATESATKPRRSWWTEKDSHDPYRGNGL
jgi:hypothetical protein